MQYILESQLIYKLKKNFLPVKLKKKKLSPLLKARITGKYIRFILMLAIPELILIVLPYKNYLRILSKGKLIKIILTYKLIGLPVFQKIFSS